MKTVAVIPCFNEARFIGDVVRKTRLVVDRVVVSDDHSTDDTIAIAKREGAEVYLNESSQRGFGSNLISGIINALESGDEEIIVTLDGDGQHDPFDIPKLVCLIKNDEAKLVIGSRFLHEGNMVPFYRKKGIGIINWIYNVGCNEKITDTQSCLRAYWRGLFKQVYLFDKKFGLSTEVLIKARRLGYPIKEVPIICIYHDELKANSTMNPIWHGIEVVIATVAWRLGE